MIRLVKILALLGCTSALYAQPYFDAVFLRGTISPDAGLWRRNYIPVTYKHFIAGVTIPVLVKTDSSKFIFNVFTERWAIKTDQIDDVPDAVQALFLPVTYIKPVSVKWTVATTLIPRWNGNASDMFNNSFQMGASVVAAFKKSSNLTYRFGLYYNSEFFGAFFIPLVGVDWKLSSRDNLFGILPQILTYEHRVSPKFSWGAAYRMYNNSYRAGYLNNSLITTYMRINEMQILLSADAYLTRHVVFNIEAGHSLFRRIRFGTDDNKKNYYSDEKVNDGFLVKAALLYRIRLR
jgi:hypothetical protein